MKTVSHMQASGWLRASRREIEIEDQEHEARFDRATSALGGWAAFWASAKNKREVFVVTDPVTGEVFRFEKGFLLPKGQRRLK